MLYSTNDLHGFTIHSTDGDLGSVRTFYFDDATWVVRYLAVDGIPIASANGGGLLLRPGVKVVAVQVGYIVLLNAEDNLFPRPDIWHDKVALVVVAQIGLAQDSGAKV